ncbi:hypothetical protein BH09BAC5_BH09BAC5_14150 [soil metagenome]
MKYIISLTFILILTSCSDKFDKGVWMQNSNDKSDNPRFDMIDDLKNNYLKIGMASQDVHSLLDQPTYIDTNKYGIHWTYPIGSNPGMHIDPYSIIIEFDSLGKYTGTDLIKH